MYSHDPIIHLLDNERIVVIKRQHWFIMAVQGASLFLLALLPLLGFFTFEALFPELATLINRYWLFILFCGAGWLQLLWMLFFVMWTNYYLDMLIITNKRILDIEQLSLFSRDMAEIRLENIQDIKVEVLGIIPSLLKMGNLHVQTAGKDKEVLFTNIPDAYQVKNTISQYYNDVVKEQYGRNHEEPITQQPDQKI